jgi:hypothetical protein
MTEKHDLSDNFFSVRHARAVAGLGHACSLSFEARESKNF